ncbi:MAG: hypothetical protein KF744_03550 [Taibaiella sp.]|nr:hypothetical protein [Taibaiella sp.]
MRPGKLLLLFCLLIFSKNAVAQGMYGFRGGLGFNTGGYHSKKTPVVEGYWMLKALPGLYAGITAGHQRYSVNQDVSGPAPSGTGTIYNVRQKSSYLFLSPTIDYGFGTRKYFHVFASAGAGFYAGGGQWSENKEYYFTTTKELLVHNSDINTSYNIPGVIMKYSFGFTERIPTRGYWNITLTQEYSGLPGGISNGPFPFNTNYFAFTVGIMHKYPMVFVEY